MGLVGYAHLWKPPCCSQEWLVLNPQQILYITSPWKYTINGMLLFKSPRDLPRLHRKSNSSTCYLEVRGTGGISPRNKWQMEQDLANRDEGTPKWMVCEGKPHLNGWFRGTPILGNLQTGTQNGNQHGKVTIFMALSCNSMMISRDLGIVSTEVI